jgi:hypothetical protein
MKTVSIARSVVKRLAKVALRQMAFAPVDEDRAIGASDQIRPLWAGANAAQFAKL